MGFRRKGSQIHEDQRRWNAWLDAHRRLVIQAGLTESILRSERDWWEFLGYTYHPSRVEDSGKFVYYDAGKLTRDQASALWQLIGHALEELRADVTEGERRSLERTYIPISWCSQT